MAMRTQELHPTLVHAPLVLLPAAALVDVLAAARPRERRLQRTGRRLWWAASLSGLAAGLAGMAASQEVQLDTDDARDAMFVHGIGNLTLVVSALGIAVWRARRVATPTSAVAGVVATCAAAYTAYLGGQLVYAHGAGVVRLGGVAAESPALFSRTAPGRLGRDAVRGLLWLLRRGGRALTSKQRVNRTALGPIAEAGAAAGNP